MMDATAYRLEVYWDFWEEWPNRLSPFAALMKQQRIEYLHGVPCRVVMSKS